MTSGVLGRGASCRDCVYFSLDMLLTDVEDVPVNVSTSSSTLDGLPMMWLLPLNFVAKECKVCVLESV